MIEYITLSTLQNAVARYIDDSAADTISHITDVANFEYEDLSHRYIWPELTRLDTSTVLQLSTEGGFFPLPKDCRTVLAMSLTSGPWPIEIFRAQDFLRRYTSTLSSSGTPEEATEVGTFAQTRLVLTGENLSVFSSVIGDTSAVRLVGLFGGEIVQVNVQLNGTTPVSAMTVQAGLSIISFSSAGDNTGNVSLRGDTSLTVYAVKNSKDRSVKYRWFRGHYVGTGSNVTINLAYQKSVERLAATTSSVEIPVGAILTERCIARMWGHKRMWTPMKFHYDNSERMLNDLLNQKVMTESAIQQSFPAMGNFGGGNKRNYQIRGV